MDVTTISWAFNSTVETLFNTTNGYNETTNDIFNSTSDVINETTTSSPSRGGGGGPPPLGYYGDMREILWKVIPPIIIVWGTIGKILTFLVLIRQRKLSSTAMFLLVLALSDLLTLYLGPLRNWIKFTWEIDVRYLSESGCKAQLYLTYCSMQISSWMLVAVTLERTLSVIRPHKVRLCCTSTRAALIIVGIIVFILGFSMVVPITNTLYGLNNQKCSPSSLEYRQFRDNIFVWMDLAMTYAVPCALLLIGNIIIVVQLYRSRSKQRKMSSSKTGRRSTQSVSVLMICLCVIFLLTMTPLHVFLIISPSRMDYVFELYKTDPFAAWDYYQSLLFVQAIVTFVGYTNSAFNFILYVFSGTKFRAELMALFCFKKPPVHGAFGSKGTASSGKKTTSVTSVRSSGVYLVNGQSNSSMQGEISDEHTAQVKTLIATDNVAFDKDIH